MSCHVMSLLCSAVLCSAAYQTWKWIAWILISRLLSHWHRLETMITTMTLLAGHQQCHQNNSQLNSMLVHVDSMSNLRDSRQLWYSILESLQVNRPDRKIEYSNILFTHIVNNSNVIKLMYGVFIIQYTVEYVQKAWILPHKYPLSTTNSQWKRNSHPTAMRIKTTNNSINYQSVNKNKLAAIKLNSL